jgi:hypothetical protein
MSAASEATLQELLQVNQQMAAAISTLAKQSGGGGGGGGGGGAGPTGVVGKAFGALGASAGVVTGILGKGFSGALGIASSGLGALAQTGSTLLKNQMALAEGAIAGTNSLSDLTKGLESLPFGLGLVAQAMNYQTRKMEKNIETYQKISDVGARFGGSLDEVRRSAASTYLSMDEFASMMKSSGPQLRFMGGSAEEGAKNLVKFNSTLIKGEVGKGLLGMGFSLEQANGMLASYSEAVGGLKADQLKDQRAMEQSVKFFAEELDAAAQLEGKTREQKEKEMKEASQQAAVKAKLAEMGPEEQKKYLAAYNAALRIGGKGAAEALQSQLLGLPPMTKAAQQFTAVNGEAAATVSKLGDTITDGTDAVTARARQDRLAAEGVVQSGEMYKKLGVTGAALSMKNGEMAGVVNAAAGNYADNMNQGVKTAEDAENRIKKVRSEQETAQKSQVGAIVQAQGAAKHAGGLMDMLAEALKPLFPVIEWLIKGFAELLPKVMSFVGDIVKVVTGVFKGLFGGMTMDQFIKPFKDFWDGLFGGSGASALDVKSITEGITNFLKPMVELFGTVIRSIDFRALGEKLGVALKNLWNTAKEIFEPILIRMGAIFGTIAKDFGPVMEDVFDIFNSIIDIIRTVIWPIMKPVVDGLMNAILPLWEAFKSIIGAIKALLKGDFSSAGKLLGDAIGNIWNALKELIKGIWEGIKNMASMGWEKLKEMAGFGGKKEEAKAPPAPVTPPNTASNSAPPAPNQPLTEDAKKRAEQANKPTPVTASANNASTPSSVQPKSNDPIEILRAEIATLNNISAELLRAMRDTRDYTKSAANTLASNGNLFKRG